MTVTRTPAMARYAVSPMMPLSPPRSAVVIIDGNEIPMRIMRMYTHPPSARPATRYGRPT